MLPKLQSEKSLGKKIPIHLRSVGNAISLAQQKYKLEGTKVIYEVEKFLRKSFQINAEQSLYLYCGSGFSPTPDQLLQDLFDCFQSNGELIIFYGIQEAWG